VLLDKDNFFPVKVTRTSSQLGNRSFYQVMLTNVKVNGEVQNSIEEYKRTFIDYSVIFQEKRKTNTISGGKFPKMSLPDVMHKGKIVDVNMDRPTLVDFWEVWCGPCIESFPKVERLKNLYSGRLRVVGVVTEDEKNAIKLITASDITFLNLMGNKKLTDDCNVTSYPRYFLVDKTGIVKQEYFGFSVKIEQDIRKM
jgi:thiol-disulfide isomerase/thioredoxin